MLALRALRNQARNIKYLISDYPIAPPSLGSMTLDKDDVDLAKAWLNNQEDWTDQSVISEFEEKFARWNGSEYAFAFMGGRVALSAAIQALDLHPGDEVILPGYTCVVVPNAFHFAGVKTVYCDIELDTYGLDATQIQKQITINTKAILLHHLYGIVCRDYEKIINIAHKHGLYVIEDCAQSTGAIYHGKKVGNFGDIAIYSSEKSKIFNTIQGGLATTNEDRLADNIKKFQRSTQFPDKNRIKSLLTQLIVNYYRYKHPKRWYLGDLANLYYGDQSIISTTIDEIHGTPPDNYSQRLPAPLASIGINQLKKLDHYNSMRQGSAHKWDKWCDQHGYRKPVIIEDSSPVYLRYPVLVEPAKKQQKDWARKELGVDIGVWFIGNTHPVRERSITDCPNADKAVAQCINFPCLI